MEAKKAIKQNYEPNLRVLSLLEAFRRMTNDCIRIGLRANISTLKRLSLTCYRQLSSYSSVPSYYKVCAISRAAGILSSRKKSIKRGYTAKNPCSSKLVLVSCYGFKVENGWLGIPVSNGEHESIPLDTHTLQVLSQPDIQIRSFTLTDRTLSLCFSKEIREAEPRELSGALGIDRNLRNVTVGSAEQVTYYDVSKILQIHENTSSVVSSFKRNDARIRKKIASKYGRRKAERVNQIVHKVSKDIVRQAKEKKRVIVFEDIAGIRKLYQKGSFHGRRLRGKMNSAPIGEIKRQVGYKAAWEGIPIITLTKRDTSGTTMDCPKCGERLQSAARDDASHHRQLWCNVCKKWRDRDLVAVLNISRRGWVRFAHSEGGASEAVKGNPARECNPAILRVDASKLDTRSRYS